MIGYPTNCLLAVVDDRSRTAALVAELTGAGVDPGHVRVLDGEDGARSLDGWGRRSGLAGRAYRWIQFMAMDQTPDFERYEREVLEGHAVIVLRAPDARLRAVAVQILLRHGAHFANWYGRLETHPLAP